MPDHPINKSNEDKPEPTDPQALPVAQNVAYVPELPLGLADTQSKTCGIVWKIRMPDSKEDESLEGK